MGRSVKEVKLDSKSSRKDLAVRKSPYWRLISKGAHIGYYKGNKKSGTWYARVRDPDTGEYSKSVLGMANDNLDANGTTVLSYDQAFKKASAYINEILSGGEITTNKKYTVNDAVEDYLIDFKASGKKSLKSTKYQIDAHILPQFGKVLLKKLTYNMLNTWKNSLAMQPKRTRPRLTKPKDKYIPVVVDENDEDYKRKRRASANRIITTLKAILNHAYHNNKVAKDDAWKKLKPFKNVSEPKIRYLKEDEVIRLLNACEPDFRALVRGALLTGARYGELTKLTKGSVCLKTQSIYIAESKSGKQRHIPLNLEGVKFFKQQIMGLAEEDLVFTRADGKPWRKNYQVRPLAAACKIAKIVPAINFHILRHTYGSALAMRGVPLQVIATVLGHSDTRITHKHYAHLMPSYVADVIKEQLPGFGEAVESDVKDINDYRYSSCA